MQATKRTEAELQKKEIGELELRNGEKRDAWRTVMIFEALRSVLENAPEGQRIVREMYEVATGELPMTKKELSASTYKQLFATNYWRTKDGKSLKEDVKEILLQCCEFEQGATHLARPWKDTKTNEETLRRVKQAGAQVMDDLRSGKIADDDPDFYARN